MYGESKVTQQIVPWIRFGNQARAAVDLYVSVFNDAEVLNDNGSESAGAQADGPGTISFRLAGLEFRATNSG
jgi:predicted 3-demethylubiquinone-9 3-methyltransferase (glyoxalase superfamily)